LAWQDFAGWRVNDDQTLLAPRSLVMAPPAFWSSECAPKMKLPPLFLPGKRQKCRCEEALSGVQRSRRADVAVSSNLQTQGYTSPEIAALAALARNDIIE
jgi:hypothetical protein